MARWGFVTLFGLVLCGSTLGQTDANADDYKILGPEGFATIPFEIFRDDIVLIADINGQKLRLAFDNGVLWDQLLLYGSERVDALKLRYDDQIEIGGAGEDKPMLANMASSVTVRLPGVELRNQPVIVTPADSRATKTFDGEDGIISGSLWKHFVVDIDFDKQIITLARPADAERLKVGQALALRRVGTDSYAIPCMVHLMDGEGVAVDIAIDLAGNLPMTLFTDRPKPVAVPPHAFPMRLGIGAQGDIQGHLGRIRTIQIGKYELPDVLSGFTEGRGLYGGETVGDIGLPLISHFNVTFDYFNSTLYLRPNRSFDKPFEYDMSGLEMRRTKDGDLSIVTVLSNSPASDSGLTTDDVVVEIDGRSVREAKRWEFESLFLQAGKTISVTVERDGKRREVKLKLRRVI